MTESIREIAGPLERIQAAIARLHANGTLGDRSCNFKIGLSNEGMRFLWSYFEQIPSENPFAPGKSPWRQTLLGHKVVHDPYVHGLGFKVTRLEQSEYGELADVEEPIVC